MFKIKLVTLSIIITCNCYGQTKKDSLLVKNKQTIARLKNRITTIENIGTDNNSSVHEIAQLKAIIKRQSDSITLLTKIINDNLITKYNSKTKKTTKELNTDLKNSDLVSANLSDCNCFRLFYNPAQTRIDYNQFQELDSLANVLKTNPNQKLKLSGHADKTGVEINNIVFSKTRVENLKRYLIEQKNVSASNIAIEWHGSAIPSKDAEDANKQFLNRRVEVLLEGTH